MDKVELILKEVERLQNSITDGEITSGRYMLNKVLSFIKPLLEEPNKVWHDANEMPKKGFSILVYMNDDSTKILSSWAENGDFCLGEGFWYNLYKQRCWAYIDDLLPKSETEYECK